MLERIKKIIKSRKYYQDREKGLANYNGFYKWSTKNQEEDYKFIDDILKKVYPDALHFYNFTENAIRFGSDWNYGTNMQSFDGVKYVPLSQFLSDIETKLVRKI